MWYCKQKKTTNGVSHTCWYVSAYNNWFVKKIGEKSFIFYRYKLLSIQRFPRLNLVVVRFPPLTWNDVGESVFVLCSNGYTWKIRCFVWKFLKREKNTVVSVILIDIHSVVYQKIQIMISCPILNSRFLDKCLLYALNLFGVFILFNDFKHVNLRLFFLSFLLVYNKEYKKGFKIVS